MKKVNVLGVIPARGGSKGIRGKNVYPLCGKPLIAYTIKAAQASKLLTDVIVSTDSAHIAQIAKRYGANVPFLRPKELAKDQTPTWPVLRHALFAYEQQTGKKYDMVMLLQPTTPLRTAEDIDEAIRMLARSPKNKSLISCYDGIGAHPRIMYKQIKGKVLPFIRSRKEMARRQSFENVYVRNGAIYLSRRVQLLQGRKVIGQNPLLMEMPRWRSINIDSIEDLKIAGLLLRYGKN